MNEWWVSKWDIAFKSDFMIGEGNKSMNELANECVNEYIIERLTEGIKKWMTTWGNKPMNESTSDCVNERECRRINKRMNYQSLMLMNELGTYWLKGHSKMSFYFCTHSKWTNCNVFQKSICSSS